MPYDAAEVAIRSLLEAIATDWNAGRRFDWTREVATRLCQLAKTPEFNFGACARGRPGGAEYGEWLYDICWYVEDEVCLTHLPLVGECEWGPTGPCDGDFQKLLQARADHRLWIFQVPTEEAAASMFKGCRENVQRFRASQRDDRYLFAGLVWTDAPSFRFDLYVHS
jgi:hypothetical protein